MTTPYASVTGRSILVVGGARGIGRAISSRLAQQKASVTLTAREQMRADSAAAELREHHHQQQVKGLQLDVTHNTDTDLNQWFNSHGVPDAVIFNAGISPIYSRAEKITDAEWDQIVDTNLRGAFVVARAYGRRLIESRSPGCLVVVSSIAALTAADRLTAYTASKHGLTGLVKNLALEWAEKNIRVNAIAPGWVRTDLTAGLQANPVLEQKLIDSVPMGYLAEPEAIADVAVFLCSDSARYVTGATWAVDGGLTCG